MRNTAQPRVSPQIRMSLFGIVTEYFSATAPCGCCKNCNTHSVQLFPKWKQFDTSPCEALFSVGDGLSPTEFSLRRCLQDTTCHRILLFTVAYNV